MRIGFAEPDRAEPAASGTSESRKAGRSEAAGFVKRKRNGTRRRVTDAKAVKAKSGESNFASSLPAGNGPGCRDRFRRLRLQRGEAQQSWRSLLRPGQREVACYDSCDAACCIMLCDAGTERARDGAIQRGTSEASPGVVHRVDGYGERRGEGASERKRFRNDRAG